MSRYPKPLIKWVGGKTQILDELIGRFPKEMNNYHEIFLGGGSVLLAVLSCVKDGLIKIKGSIYGYDSNESLISLFKVIQSKENCIKFFDELQILIGEFNNCVCDEINRQPKNIAEAKVSRENYYYWIRNEFNKLSDKKTIRASSMFLFLNKTCFRGLFRVGPSGFNVPYGHYKNPSIINEEHLIELHHLIQNVIFECCDFQESLSRIVENDFVYLDPPYAPEKRTSFVGYTKNGFNLENHLNLFEKIHMLKTKMILSNADVSLVRDNFEDKKYKIESITCKRLINSTKPGSKTTEVIINNY